MTISATGQIEKLTKTISASGRRGYSMSMKVAVCVVLIFYVNINFNAWGDNGNASDVIKTVDPDFTVSNIRPLLFLKEQGKFSEVKVTDNSFQSVNDFSFDQILLIIAFENHTQYGAFALPKDNKFFLKINGVQKLATNIPSPGGGKYSYYTYLIDDVFCKGDFDILVRTEDEKNWKQLKLSFTCGE